MSWYYMKSLNRGDTGDIIPNVENVFVCWDKILEDTSESSQKFPSQIPVAESRASSTFVFAAHSNFTHDYENYDFTKL